MRTTLALLLTLLALSALFGPSSAAKLAWRKATPAFRSPSHGGMSAKQVPGMRALLSAGFRAGKLHVRLSKKCRCFAKCAVCVSSCYRASGKKRCCAKCAERWCLNKSATC